MLRERLARRSAKWPVRPCQTTNLGRQGSQKSGKATPRNNIAHQWAMRAGESSRFPRPARGVGRLILANAFPFWIAKVGNVWLELP